MLHERRNFRVARRNVDAQRGADLFLELTLLKLLGPRRKPVGQRLDIGRPDGVLQPHRRLGNQPPGPLCVGFARVVVLARHGDAGQERRQLGQERRVGRPGMLDECDDGFAVFHLDGFRVALPRNAPTADVQPDGAMEADEAGGVLRIHSGASMAAPCGCPAAGGIGAMMTGGGSGLASTTGAVTASCLSRAVKSIFVS